MAMQHRHDDDNQKKGLVIDIVPELRRRIAEAAAENNLSVQEYVAHLLEETVPVQKNPTQKRTGRLNHTAIEKLRRTREEIKRAHPGQMFENSSELIHEAREERTRELEQL